MATNHPKHFWGASLYFNHMELLRNAQFILQHYEDDQDMKKMIYDYIEVIKTRVIDKLGSQMEKELAHLQDQARERVERRPVVTEKQKPVKQTFEYKG
jgi:hypothetical protein